MTKRVILKFLCSVDHKIYNCPFHLVLGLSSFEEKNRTKLNGKKKACGLGNFVQANHVFSIFRTQPKQSQKMMIKTHVVQSKEQTVQISIVLWKIGQHYSKQTHFSTKPSLTPSLRRDLPSLFQSSCALEKPETKQGKPAFPAEPAS